MGETFQFSVPSSAVTIVEFTDEGIYLRFLPDAKVNQTLIRNEWPHVAVDLTENNEVVGIELIPHPENISIATIAMQAGVKLPRELSTDNIQLRRSVTPASLAET